MSDLIYEALNTQIMTVWRSVSDIIQVLETKVLSDDSPSEDAQKALVNLRDLHDLMRNYEQLIKLRLECKRCADHTLRVQAATVLA